MMARRPGKRNRRLSGLPNGVPLTVTIIDHNPSGDDPEREAATLTLR